MFSTYVPGVCFLFYYIVRIPGVSLSAVLVAFVRAAATCSSSARARPGCIALLFLRHYSFCASFSGLLWSCSLVWAVSLCFRIRYVDTSHALRTVLPSINLRLFGASLTHRLTIRIGTPLRSTCRLETVYVETTLTTSRCKYSYTASSATTAVFVCAVLLLYVAKRQTTSVPVARVFAINTINTTLLLY